MANNLYEPRVIPTANELVRFHNPKLNLVKRLSRSIIRAMENGDGETVETIKLSETLSKDTLEATKLILEELGYVVTINELQDHVSESIFETDGTYYRITISWRIIK